MKIYQLNCIDLSNDNEIVHSKWIKPFESLISAQAYAESTYHGFVPIKWEKYSENKWSSGELGLIEYTIEEVELGTIDDVKQNIPQMIRDYDLDLTELKDILIQYMEYLSSNDYNEDKATDYEHLIFEVAVVTFYGKDIFEKYVNRII